jgi:hypothetical protein
MSEDIKFYKLAENKKAEPRIEFLPQPPAEEGQDPV